MGCIKTTYCDEEEYYCNNDIDYDEQNDYDNYDDYDCYPWLSFDDEEYEKIYYQLEYYLEEGRYEQ